MQSNYFRRKEEASRVSLPDGWQRESFPLSTLQVMNLTGLSPQHISLLVKQGKFPMHFKITERRNAWDSLEIAEWLEQKMNQRRVVKRGRE